MVTVTSQELSLAASLKVSTFTLQIIHKQTLPPPSSPKTSLAFAEMHFLLFLAVHQYGTNTGCSVPEVAVLTRTTLTCAPGISNCFRSPAHTSNLFHNCHENLASGCAKNVLFGQHLRKQLGCRHSGRKWSFSKWWILVSRSDDSLLTKCNWQFSQWTIKGNRQHHWDPAN